MTVLLPADLRSALGAFASVGVALFAFGVGLELDGSALRHRGHVAVAVSHASIALPFVGGCFLALGLKGELGPPGAFAPFCLFLGTAMSVTAFPVLARILEETGLLRTPLGHMSILCAAVDDVTAWIVLSVVVALARSGGWLPAVRTLVLAGILVAVMLGPVRHLLESVGSRPARASAALAASAALLTAAVTDWMGLHVIFGAFLAGCAMPRSGPLAEEARRLAPLTTGVLLPLFFVMSGLQVDLRGLGQHPGELVAGVAILAVAISGKMLGAGLGALWGGATRTDAVAIGVLMNTRGLTELVVLGVGLQLGVLSPPLYTLLVLMALVTTGMTAPLLRRLGVSGRMGTTETTASSSGRATGNQR
jgi:Kef-type K+ transport system membrane component KefB